jgi:hypothetical protein
MKRAIWRELVGVFKAGDHISMELRFLSVNLARARALTNTLTATQHILITTNIYLINQSHFRNAS